MSQGNEEWELSKENIRPIKQGRKQKVLKVALAAHPEDVILQQRQSFENELRTYSGDDPLSVWCEYIKWVEQNFPKGGREGHIKELIERCISILKNEKKYFDDDRFIDIMLSYAILGGKPTDVYNYMFSNNIGCKSAKLFINWSWELEQMNNLKKADEILNEGLNRKAEPHEKISSYYKDFEIRLADKIKADVEHNDSEPENNRSAFAMLKPQKKNLAPILRTGEAVVENKKIPLLGRQQPQPKSVTKSVKVPFEIYDAKNIDSSVRIQSRCIVPSDLTSDNYKENEIKPSKWNKVKVKAHGLNLKAINDVKPGFKFHCDDETGQELSTPRSVPKTSILTTRCRTPPLPMAFFEPPDPLSRNMYPKNKIYGGAEEFSLEEIRAAEWFGNRKKIEQNLEKQKTDYKIEQHLELKPNHPQNLVSIQNTEINHSESLMTENNKFNKTLNVEKSEENLFMTESNKFHETLNTEKSEVNLNCFIQSHAQNNKTSQSGSFEDKDANSTNKAIKVIKNLNDPAQKCSINNNRGKLNSNNEFSKKCTPVASNNSSELMDVNQREQKNSISKEYNSKVPFMFYHDSTNE